MAALEHREPVEEGVAAEEATRKQSSWRRRLVLTGTQLGIVVGVLALWEYLPSIEALSSRIQFLNPFFISSPGEVAERLVSLVAGTGSQGDELIWPYVWPTFGAALLGTALGLVFGGLLGLIMSSSEFVSALVKPFVVGLNAIPRIALIPIVIVVFGTNFQSSVIISVMVVFFLGLFNAYEGGRTVSQELISNAVILGASRRQVMRQIRFPYALAWTMATLPVAISFSVLTVITGEILTGTLGIGRLIAVATQTAQASLTFSVVIILSVLTVVLVGVAELVRRRLLHWWG